METKYQLIKESILQSTSKNPIEIVESIMKKDFINMHGPEHHFLDGAALLMAYYNTTKSIHIEACLDELASRTIKMPGAMCGKWAVCGAVASIGASMSVIHETGPLSTDEHYKNHMVLTSRIIEKQSKIGGARCCKRNAFLALTTAIEVLKEHYGIELESKDIVCSYYSNNKQCILDRCPYHPK